MLYKAYYKCKEKIMKTLRFSNLNDLLAWCRNNPDSLVYWGFLENFDEWCTTAELAAEMFHRTGGVVLMKKEMNFISMLSRYMLNNKES